MKKEIQVLICLLGVSCAVEKTLETSTVDLGKTYLTEFPKYSNFFLTDSSGVNFEYENFGTIFSRVVFDYDEKKKGENISDHYSANPEKVINLLHENAVNIGADGLINVKLEYVPTIPPSFYSSGTAIKRKK